jgi:hypothetical protein
MTNWSKARSKAAILFIFVAMVVSGCAGGQTSQQTGQQTVSMQYMLTESGFQPWGVNLETPKRQALLESMPTGKIVTYRRDGEVYHVYADERFNTLYIGDEAAYQKYLSMARGKQLCERVDAQSPQEFWRCLEETQKPGGKN